MPLDFKIVKDLPQAKEIWDKLSPKETLWDEWDFRYCFYKYYNWELFFYTGSFNGKIIGVLPLEYNPGTKSLEFFGGKYMEENKIFVENDYRQFIPDFYKQIDRKAELCDISCKAPLPKGFLLQEYKYIYNLSGISTLEQFLDKYFNPDSKKKKKRLLKEKVEIICNNFNDFEIMIGLNLKNFGKESSFHSPFRKEIFRDLLKLNYKPILLTSIIDGKKEAVSFAIKYKDRFISLNSGVNSASFPWLEKYLILKKVAKAIELKCQVFDACAGNYGWKEYWHLEKIPQFKYCIST
ncbi:MAG: GNAT family N-acetyltransferase [Candidatus Nealsonbacteria bacterium]